MAKATKLALVGAGQIGGTLAHLAAQDVFDEIALYDIAGDMARGKALDLMQAGAVEGFEARIRGGDEDSLVRDADVVIVTSGLPRKPGMSRDDLIESNCAIIKKVGALIKKQAPRAFVIVVTNPLDVMVWVMRQVTGFPHAQVVGMAGVLDSARFAHFLSAALGIAKNDISCTVLGGHGDLMVPLIGYSSVGGVSLDEWVCSGRLPQDVLDGIIERTRGGGGEIVKLLGTGSAFYAPAASALRMARAFVRDEKRLLTAAAWLRDAYGERDVYAGVPVTIGAGGVEQIVQLSLSDSEQAEFQQSVAAVRELVAVAEKML